MRLMTHMAVAGYRNPFQLAKAITTLDVVSNGRTIVGLGSGYLRSEFAALGVDFDERGALFDECLEALDGIFSNDDFKFEGFDVSAITPGKFITADDSVEYHLDAIGELAAIGVTWTMFPYPRKDFGAALDYIRMYGEEVVAKSR